MKVGPKGVSTVLAFFALSTLVMFSADVRAVDLQGPVVTSLMVRPNPTNGAKFLDIEAIVDDRSMGGSRIAAAELFVDRPGFDGQGLRMTGLRDTFTTALECANGWLDVSMWSQGETRTLFVHGRDAEGQWGALTSITLQVTAIPPFDLRLLCDASPLILRSGSKRFVYDLNRTVRKTELRICNEKGHQIYEASSLQGNLGVSMGTWFWLWDGKSSNGSWAKPGIYRIEMTAYPLKGERVSREATFQILSK